MLSTKSESKPLGQADFPNSPDWWQCCISLPDERDKVLVGKAGEILLDYEREGRGKRHFRTVISASMDDGLEFVSQSLESAKMPLISTQLRNGSVDFMIESVAAPIGGEDTLPVLRRQGGEEKITGWDGPRFPRTRRDFVSDSNCPPEFRDVAWAQDGQSIVYEWRIPPGSSGTMVAGFAEGEYREKGRRILQVEADGAETQKVDAADRFGINQTGLIRLQVRDNDGDGIICLKVFASEESPDQCAFLSSVWAFLGEVPRDEALLAGEKEHAAFVSCSHEALSQRRFLTRIVLRNRTGEEMSVAPIIRVQTLERARVQGGNLEIGHLTKICADPPFLGAAQVESGFYLAQLTEKKLPPEGNAEWFFCVDRHGMNDEPFGANAYEELRLSAIEGWQQQALPYDMLEIPDERIQSLIDSSIRNIYQARDIQNGLPAFHVGPTCYRQLWIVDGAFLLETAALLGRAHEARAGLTYMLGFQEADGSYQLKARYWKEAGIVLWTVLRHAELTGDLDWLRSVWPRVEAAVKFLQSLRQREEAANPASPIHRLAPYGDIDGGISNMGNDERFPEFSNTYWNLIGIKSAAQAAELLGEESTAHAWRAEFEDLLAVFRHAAEAGMCRDSEGHRYLPIRLGIQDPSQKGQWAFCHAVHPGGIFPSGDSFVQGMLDMLDSRKVEGLVLDTGWMKDGLWTYFASFLGHAHLWHGNPSTAYSDLEAFADHAAPVLVWREEQKPSECGNEEVGDMPHNWASAEFIRLAFHLIAMERGKELHLFEGVPAKWLHSGKILAVRGVATAFGPLTLSFSPCPEGATMEISPLHHGCERIVVHRQAWKPSSEVLVLSPDKSHCIFFSE